MPFKSTAQRSYLAIHKPDVARKFAADSKGQMYHVGKDGRGPLESMFGKKKGK